MTMHIPTGAVNWQEIASNIAVAISTVGHGMVLLSSAKKVGQSEYVAVNEMSQDLRDKIPPLSVRGVIVDYKDLIEEDTNFSRMCTCFLQPPAGGVNLGDIIQDGGQEYVVFCVKKQEVGGVTLVYELELKQ